MCFHFMKLIQVFQLKLAKKEKKTCYPIDCGVCGGNGGGGWCSEATWLDLVKSN